MMKRLSWLSAVCAGVLCLAAWCGAVEFSAEMVTKVGGKTTTTKLFRKGEQKRTEFTAGPIGRIIIIRPNNRVEWMLTPSTKTYSEIVIDPKMSQGWWMPKNAAELSKSAVKKSLGAETINGFVCDKFELTYKDKAMGISIEWVARDLEWPIRSESRSADGTKVTEAKNIKVGPQPARLFEIPKGYTKTPTEPETPEETKTPPEGTPPEPK